MGDSEESFRFDVLGLGAVAVDELLYVDEYPPAERKVRVAKRLRQCGGLTGTALVAAARCGARTGYAGLLGEDALSREVIACFEREGIDWSSAVRRGDARPAHSTIIVDQTHHTRTIFADIEGPIGPDPHLPPAEVIRSARVLLVDHHGLEGTLRAVRIARAAGRQVVADLERDPGGPFGQVLDLVDHLVVSESFASKLTGTGGAAEAAAALWHPGRESVVVTCGAGGGWYVSAGEGPKPRHFDAYRVKVVDTTGCGDVFHGAYAAGLAEGLPLVERIRLAAATAAWKATRRGGQAGIPHRKAVEQFLRDSAKADSPQGETPAEP